MAEKIDDWLEAQRINGGSHGFECIGIARMQQVWNAAQEDLLLKVTLLRDASQKLIDRWDSPLWKDQPHTANYIHALREALAATEPKLQQSRSFTDLLTDDDLLHMIDE